jgi:hypothetical protein
MYLMVLPLAQKIEIVQKMKVIDNLISFMEAT